VAPAAVGRALEAAIEAELGVTTTVLLRSKEALDSVVEHNPSSELPVVPRASM